MHTVCPEHRSASLPARSLRRRLLLLYAVGLLFFVLFLWLACALGGVTWPVAMGASLLGVILVPGAASITLWFIRQQLPDFTQQADILQAMAASTPDAIFVKDRAGRYLLLNQTSLAMIGKTAAEVLGKTDTELFGEANATTFRLQDEQVMREGKLVIEERLLNVKGVRRAYLVSKTPYRNAAGEVIGIIGISRDITDRKNAEDALRASEERYRNLVELAPDGIAVFQEGKVVYINHAGVRIMRGESPADFIGLGLNDYLHPDDLAASVQRQRTVLTEQVTVPLHEIRLRAKDGTYLSLEVCSGPCTLNGAPAIQVISRNITERKQAERALLASEARYRALVECSLDAIFVNRGGVIVYANPAFYRLLGATSPTQVLGKTPYDFVHPSFHTAIRQRIQQLFDQKQPAPIMHQQYVRLDGHTVDVEVTGVPIMEDGEPAIEVILRDITERKQAENRLQKSYAFRDAIIRNAGEGIVVSHAIPEHPFVVVTVWNERMVELTGYTFEEINRIGWFHAMYPDAAKRAFAQARFNTVAAGTELRAEERTIIRKDGAIRHISISSSVLELDDDVVSIMGMMLDVTDRKNAENALRASEERYRQLVDVLPTAVSIFTDGQLTFCNPAFVRLLGANSADELLHRDALDFVAPESHALALARQEHMRTTGTPSAPAELKLQRRDGRTVLAHAIVVPLSTREPFAFLGVHSDLTEREHAAQLIRSVMQSVTDAIVTFDDTGCLQSANPATTRIFGHPEGELLGRLLHQLVPNAETATLFQQTGHALEMVGLRQDGTRFPLEVSVSAFAFNDRPRFTAVLRDLTMRRQLEGQILQAQKQLAIGRLAGGIAHDFNNLLTIINGHSDLLLLSLAADDPHRDSCAAIHEAGVRAAGLTAQLLAYGRKAMVEPKTVQLRDLITNTTALLQPLIGASITLTTTCAPNTPTVRVDHGQLEQVLMNLVLNARDAMPQGGTINVTTERRQLTPSDLQGLPNLAPGTYAQLTVHDNGCGMTDTVMAHIFEPFFTTKDFGRGTGLGLAVVEGIIAQAGGHISVRSQVGHGTTFTVWLPAQL